MADGSSGEAGYPYPPGNVKPDVPGYFKKLADAIANVTDTVANVAALPSTLNWTGRVKFVRNAPGAYFIWNGASWDMYGTPTFVSTAARDAALGVTPAAGVTAYVSGTGVRYEGVGGAWIAFQGTLLVATVAAVGSYANTARTIVELGRDGWVRGTFEFTKSSSMISGDNVGTISAGCRPAQDTGVACITQDASTGRAGSQLNILASGGIQITSPVASARTLFASAVWKAA